MSDNELNIHEVTVRDNEVSIKGDAYAVFLLAEQLGELLEENDVDNYLTMELIPSIKHTGVQKPIRVTVQWMSRKSPEEILEEKIEVIKELEAQLAALKSPWTHLITPEGEDTGEEAPKYETLLLSIRVSDARTGQGMALVDKGMYLYGGLFETASYGHMTNKEVYAFQPWPEPAPEPKGEK